MWMKKSKNFGEIVLVILENYFLKKYYIKVVWGDFNIFEGEGENWMRKEEIWNGCKKKKNRYK